MILVTQFAFAGDFVVKNNNATVYDSPEAQAKVIGKIPKGRKVITSEEKDGFAKLATKSGRNMYVKMTDLDGGADVSSDLVDENENVRQRAERGDSSGLRLTWDLGASTGSYRNESYTEINLGLNLFFTEWLAWRNAGFARFIDPKNYYGLDSSARLIFSPSFMDFLGVTVFGGPGYRFVTEGNSVAFAEGGLVLHVGGFSLGGGVKTLFHSFYDRNVPDDTQYFIILSGSGVIF